jgi:hypothetical protein
MDNPIEKLSDYDLYRSALAEAAKSLNEIRCAEADLRKANSRVTFLILILNTLLSRNKQGD